LDCGFQIIRGGHHNNGDLWEIPCDLSEKSLPGNMGHRQIEQHYTRRLLSQLRYQVAAIIQGDYVTESRRVKRDTGAAEHMRLVIDQQNWKRGDLFHLSASFGLTI
jgi:hypothetical protein